MPIPSITLPSGESIGFGDPDFLIKSGTDQGAVGWSYGFYVDQDGNLRLADDPGTGRPLGYVGTEYAGQQFATLDDLQNAQPNPFQGGPPPMTPPPGAPPTPIDDPNDPFWKGIPGGLAGVLAGGGGGGGGGGTSAPPPATTALETPNIPAYLQARPDLGHNWESSPEIRAQFPSLEAYALADFLANRGGNPQFSKEWYDQFTQAPTTPPPSTTPPPAPTETPDIRSYLQARRDLEQNWNSTPEIRNQFPTLEAYALADFLANRAGNPQFSKEWYDQFVQAPAPRPDEWTQPRSPGGPAGLDIHAQLPNPLVTDLTTPPPPPPPPAGTPPPSDRPADDQSFIRWWFTHQSQATPEDFARVTRIADGGNQDAIKALTDAGYVDTAPEAGTPLEKGLLDQALPGLISDIDADAGRRQLSAELGGQLTQSGRAAVDQLNRTQGTGSTGPAVNVEAYLRARPDLAQNYQSNPALQQQFGSLMQYAIADFNANRNGSAQFPKQWYDQFAQSAQLANDFANADQTTAANIEAINQSTAAQLQALSEATAAMQGNLSGDLAQRAAALQQQIASLLQNLDQLDATQRAALTKQVTDLQGNLDQSIATQRTALEQQIATLQGAVGAQAQAQRAALQQELAALTAAQAPMLEARTRAAELQATAVNVGLENTTDQLRADAAREGFIGGSTMQDAALARATIDARQQAAQAVGGARLANAADTRDIAVRGATGERSIAEALADAQRAITEQQANEGRGLSVAGAEGTRAIGDFGANGQAALTGQTAQARAGIGAQGANTMFQDQVFGADQKRELADALARGVAGLKTTQATGIQGARTQGNAAKATYYDNDYGRALAAQLAIPGVVGSTVQGLSALGDYGQSGLKRAQGLLNWWSTPTNNPPTPEAVAVQPSTSGLDLSKLGASLFGAASQNWWK